MKRRNDESLAALVRERPNFTAEDARFFIALCKSGQRTPDWLVDKMIGAAPTLSPERWDALSGKDSPSGTDSRSQSGRTASPETPNTDSEPPA